MVGKKSRAAGVTVPGGGILQQIVTPAVQCASLELVVQLLLPYAGELAPAQLSSFAVLCATPLSAFVKAILVQCSFAGI